MQAEARPDSTADSEATTTRDQMLQDVNAVEDFAQSQVDTNLTESEKNKRVEDNNKATEETTQGNNDSSSSSNNSSDNSDNSIDNSNNGNGSGNNTNDSSNSTDNSNDNKDDSNAMTDSQNVNANGSYDSKYSDMTGNDEAAEEKKKQIQDSKVNPVTNVNADGTVSKTVLNPMNELAFVQNAEGKSDSVVFDTYLTKQRKYNGGVTLNRTPFADEGMTYSETFYGKQVSHYKSDFGAGDEYEQDISYANIRAVAFNPHKDRSRKDCVVYVAVNPQGKDDAEFITWMYDYTAKKRSANLSLGTVHWQNVKSQTYSSEFLNFMAITAGNYYGKGYDTSVVYFPGHGSGTFDDMGLFEIDWSDMDNPKKTAVSDSAIHPDYKTALNRGWQDSSLVYDKLTCTLDSGDVNGDGIDDLAVVTSMPKPGNMDRSNMRRFEPYLSVCYGTSNGDAGTILNKANGQYVCDNGGKGKNNHYYWATIRNPGLAIGDADGDDVGEITLAGNKWFIKGVEGVSNPAGYTATDDPWDGSRLNKYVVATYRATDNKIQTIEFNSDLDSNAWKEAGTYESDRIQARCGVQYFKINGNHKPEALYIDGNVYRMSANSGKVDTSWVYTPEYFQHSDKQTTSDCLITNVYTRSVVAGNFDKNLNGREQLMILLGFKRNGMHEESISAMTIGGEYDQDVKEKDGTIKEFKDATGFYYNDMYNHDTYTCNKMNSNVEDKFSSEIVCIDIGKDGVEISYDDVDLAYTEPEVQAVLQAAPTFGDVNQTNGTTTYSTTLSYSAITDSYEWNHTWGAGFAGTIKLEAGEGSIMAGIIPAGTISWRVGWVGNWSSGWTKSRQTTYTQSFAATRVTNVVMRRIPTYLYKYKILNAKEGTNDVMTCVVPGAPYYVQYSVDDYNKFVDQYNAALAERRKTQDLSNTNELTKIEEASLLNNVGNPWSYASKLGGTNITDDNWVHKDTTGKAQSGNWSSDATWFRYGKSAGSETISISRGAATEHHWKTMNGWSSDLSVQGGNQYVQAGFYFSQQQTYGWSGGDTKTESSGNAATVYNMDKTALLANKANADDTLNSYGFSWAFAGGNIQVAKKNNGEAVSVPLLHYVLKGVMAPPAAVSMQEASYKKQSDGSTQVTVKWKLPTDDHSGRQYFTNDQLQYNVYQRDGRTMGDWTQVTDKPVTVSADSNGVLSYTFTADSTTTQTGSMMYYSVRCSQRKGSQASVESMNPTPILLLYTGDDTSSAKTGTNTTNKTATDDNDKTGKTDDTGKTGTDTGKTGDTGTSTTSQSDSGEEGLNAFQLALKNGFKGLLADWLKALKDSTGKSAYDLACEHGFQGSEIDWINSLLGNDGKNGESAYQLAVDKGYKGTLEEWLQSLYGQTGKSAYDLAKENGFSGTLEEWLAQQKGKSAYDLYLESAVAGELLTQEKFLALCKDKQQNTSTSGVYDAYVEALKETDAKITPLSQEDFFKKCISYGGAYAGYFSLANELLKAATSKMTEAEIQAIYGQVMILSEAEYNAAVKNCNSVEDYARKDVDLLNGVMNSVYAKNDSFEWKNMNYDDIKYRVLEVFEAACGYACGYSVYKDTTISADNNKSLLTQEAWLAGLKGSDGASGANGTDGKDGSDATSTTQSTYNIIVQNGFTGSLDDFINLLKQKDGTDSVDGYTSLNVEGDTGSTDNGTASNGSSNNNNSSSTNNDAASGNDSSGSNNSSSSGNDAGGSDTGSSGTSGSSSGTSGATGANEANVTTQALGTVNTKGDNGKDGRGISAVRVDDNGDLIVTYTDSVTQDAGTLHSHDPMEVLIYVSLAIGVISLLANGVLASAIYKPSPSRRKRD